MSDSIDMSMADLIDDAIRLNPTIELIDPTTGEIVNLTDPDELIDAYERIDRHADKLDAAAFVIRQSLAKLTDGQTTAKTRRVQGRRRKAKLEMPDQNWEQSILKECWNSYPSLRDQCLRIGKIDVKAREWAKLAETAGSPDVETFRDMVRSAMRPATALPTVKVEV